MWWLKMTICRDFVKAWLKCKFVVFETVTKQWNPFYFKTMKTSNIDVQLIEILKFVIQEVIYLLGGKCTVCIKERVYYLYMMFKVVAVGHAHKEL
jgi:hypothetical protein